MTLEDRAVGTYLGMAVGDALGATVEFMLPREIQAQYGVHERIRGGGWLHLKPGQVTDDTGMALALGEAILASGGIDIYAIAEAFNTWLRSKPVDVGHTVRRGISHFRCTGEPWALLVAYPAFRFRGRHRENPSAYIVETLQAVFQALFDTSTFSDCLVDVVNRGGDADTTGAIAGMIAGALYGVQAIPTSWLHDLDATIRRRCRQQALALIELSKQIPVYSLSRRSLHSHSTGLQAITDSSGRAPLGAPVSPPALTFPTPESCAHGSTARSAAAPA